MSGINLLGLHGGHVTTSLAVVDGSGRVVAARSAPHRGDVVSAAAALLAGLEIDTGGLSAALATGIG
jgi:hypothetical protein